MLHHLDRVVLDDAYVLEMSVSDALQEAPYAGGMQYYAALGEIRPEAGELELAE